jgi:hypothetical protein
MAAITPHLEEQNDPSETAEEEAYFKQSYSLGDLQFDKGDRAALATQALQVSHSNLVATAWTREVLQAELADRVLTVTTKGRSVVLELDREIGKEPRWNPPGAGDMRKFNLLSWTSKMGAPSFSLPAGPPMFGGACPGATAGQSIVPLDLQKKAARHVRAVVDEPVVLPDCVCQWCYAEGGNYRYGSKQLGQVVIYSWAQLALADGSFVEVLDWAIKHADYKLRGGADLPAERHPGKYFRVHDSGDFFSKRYLEAWRAVADRNPDVTFWAPSRIWALPGGRDWVNEINVPQQNLIIRPSAYMVDRPRGPELGPGWSSWSVVFDETTKPSGAGMRVHGGPYDWDCQAYAVSEESHNCRFALAPDGQTGCRACWVHPELAVNYTKH